MIRPLLLSAVVLLAIVSHSTDAGAQGRSIQVRDGDIVLVPTDATITIARAAPGHVKVISHQQGRILVVLLDQGPTVDGIVDYYYRFELPQPFLPEYAGEGPGSVEYYDVLGNRERRMRSYGIVLPHGRVYLRSMGPVVQSAAIPEHVATFEIKGTSFGPARATFEDAERQALRGTGVPRMDFGAGAPVAGVGLSQAAPDGPVRVGGIVRQPVKTKDVAPVMPEAARQAGIFGVVILEVTIDAQGRVSNTRVLRSIPLLDQAAVDAVRRWEFEPTFIDGQPRAVIMTVPVPFQ